MDTSADTKILKVHQQEAAWRPSCDSLFTFLHWMLRQENNRTEHVQPGPVFRSEPSRGDKPGLLQGQSQVSVSEWVTGVM